MNTLEKHVLELIGEDIDSPDVFTEESDGMAQIRDSLSDAIEEICMLTGSYKENYYLPLMQNRAFYRLVTPNGDMAWITDAWLVTQKRRLEQTDLIRLNHHNPRWMKDSGTPRSYFPIGSGYTGLWPCPTTDGDVLDITMVVIPERYTESTDRIKLKSDFQWAAVHFAVSEFWASRGDAKSAMKHLMDYADRLGLQMDYPVSAERQWQHQTYKDPWPKSTG